MSTGNGKRDHRERDHEITLAELQHKVFPPTLWIVPNYLPEGLTVFAGKPKIGKSWLVLGIALAAARGTETLGQFVEPGDVLYNGLEDGEKRLRARVEKVLGVAVKKWPANFTFRERMDALDAGGHEQIEKWLIEHPKRRLVVIDTFGKVRGMKTAREEPYQYDYRVVSSLQELATFYHVAIVLVHHVRKSDAEDVLDTINGTTGIAGAADHLIILGKTKQGIRLYMRGRDTEEQDKLVEFDGETGLWSVTGDHDEMDPSQGLHGLRKRIYDLLIGSPVALAPKDVATRLNADRAHVRVVLTRMANAFPAQAYKSADVPGAYSASKTASPT